MKKLILSILFILCLSFQASAFNPMVVVSGGGAAVSYDLTETFESSGDAYAEYDNVECGTAPCVTENIGDPTGDDTNMTGKIGFYNLALDHTEEISFTFTPADETSVWVLMKWEYSDAVESDEIFLHFSNASNSSAFVYVKTDGSFSVSDRVDVSETATGIHSAGTPIWLKFEAIEGTSSDTVIRLWYWTTEWVGPAERTAGTGTGDIFKIRLANNQDDAAEDQYVDNLFIKVGGTDPFTGDPAGY